MGIASSVTSVKSKIIVKKLPPKRKHRCNIILIPFNGKPYPSKLIADFARTYGIVVWKLIFIQIEGRMIGQISELFIMNVNIHQV